ncbi:MAG TPA: cysteine--tRNA ligase [Phycisphaerae bacterium]|nr:cysteine--tRNA ligase [Phycisphaerales bacterium]HRX85128.1 cysteine--tRNA ligase [Phycisphaerae bacterium]
MNIQIHNTLTNRKEPFEPVTPGQVGMYLCGPTVYKPSHIGHAVGPVIFDAIKRYLVHRGFAVTWVVNITDVDDKLIAEAAAQGVTVPELARRVTQNYFDALAALNVTGIDHFPKASEHIGGIIDICERLIAKNAAYVVDGDVYFDVTADADYGKLSNRTLADQQEGTRELTGKTKRHPGDFALWKAAKPDEPAEVKFDSPWGPGRPGWHIECSAMAIALLGETFDIHGGGLDLIFPHHENEIAQSETCTNKTFAKYWLHNGLTRFNTKKVSKSDPAMQKVLAEMTLSNLLATYSGELLRYFILSTQYRSPIEYSQAELASKRKGLSTFLRLFARIETVAGASVYADAPADAALPAWCAADADDELAVTLRDAHDRFHAAMDDDFNTAVAIAALFELANALNRYIEHRKLDANRAATVRERTELDANRAATVRERTEQADAPSGADHPSVARVLDAGRVLVALGRVLGLFTAPPEAATAGDAAVEKVLAAHVAVRARCRADKQFELADAVRDGLTAAGVTLEDKASGTTWQIDAGGDDLMDKLMAVHLDVRQRARQAKNFAIADAIRDALAEANITLEDKPTGTVWHLGG